MIQTIKKSILGAIIFSSTVMLFGLAYSTFSTLSTVNSGDTLTSDRWNEIINRLNIIKQKQLITSWVNFDGTDCTGGDGSDECTIKDSYNISKIVRIDIGRYKIYFGTDMDNINYIFSGSAGNQDSTTLSGRDITLDGTKYTDYFNIRNTYDTDTTRNDENIMVQILGGID